MYGVVAGRPAVEWSVCTVLRGPVVWFSLLFGCRRRHLVGQRRLPWGTPPWRIVAT